jgi:hypothetical protein
MPYPRQTQKGENPMKARDGTKNNPDINKKHTCITSTTGQTSAAA